MKPLLVLLLTFSVFTACRKYNSGGCTTDPVVAELKGTWELRSVYGGMVPGGNYLPGNGNIVKFTDSTFEKHRNGQIVTQGIYSVSQGNNPQTNLMTKRINYPDGYVEYFEISGRQLTLYSGMIALDGTISRYEKL